ncbi:MAG: hypothetical protein H7Z41_16575 [Cytophagales bacterium]|nr:hypothetical protein [Armatimonadota bacterium]
MEPSVPRIEAIYLAPLARAPMTIVSEATLVAGRGIVGDRYFDQAGTFSDWPLDHEFTLVEAEAIEAVASEYGIVLAPGETRRGVVTRGVALNALVGRRFQIGGLVLCEGTRLCPPCAHLEVVTGKGGLARMLAGRGGLRARILTGGVIRPGDELILLAPIPVAAYNTKQ